VEKTGEESDIRVENIGEGIDSRVEKIGEGIDSRVEKIAKDVTVECRILCSEELRDVYNSHTS
jgi:hypothetical protein